MLCVHVKKTMQLQPDRQSLPIPCPSPSAKPHRCAVGLSTNQRRAHQSKPPIAVATLLQGPGSRGNETQCDSIITAEHTTTTQKYGSAAKGPVLILTPSSTCSGISWFLDIHTSILLSRPPSWNPLQATTAPTALLFSAVNSSPPHVIAVHWELPSCRYPYPSLPPLLDIDKIQPSGPRFLDGTAPSAQTDGPNGKQSSTTRLVSYPLPTAPWHLW